MILSGFYLAGEFGPYSVELLLRRLYESRDFPTLLKQAYRFDVYISLRNEIDEALSWHTAKNLPDAEVWRHKFTKLREQELLRLQARPSLIEVEEELPESSTETPKTFQLKPLLAITAARSRCIDDEAADDPYILSQTARAKMERANSVHKTVLEVLKTHLRSRNRDVAESKLVDAYAVLDDGPAIFEVKSITASNERDQVRHAISQLYEYRFLHAMPDASLWIVFSQAPSSQWYIDYLAGDRGIRLAWLSEGALQGPSIDQLT